MEEQYTSQEMDSFATQVFPSTSNKGKRKPNPQGKSSKQPAAKQQRVSTPGKNSEAVILPNIKGIMEEVTARLQDQNELSAFLKKKITELDKDKRVQIGVFGETGAGKSSLINAIIDEENLLPSSDECTSACTSVIIKVEASVDDKYQALIEFLKTEEWNDELWYLLQSAGDKNNEETADDDDDDDDDDDSNDYIENKLSALYGEEWKKNSSKDLTEKKCFSDIHELLKSGTKTFTCKTAMDLSGKLTPYTMNSPLPSQSKKGKRYYWPIVKCVTVKVPNKDLLQHVTLVDLPGSGDCNKSRDEMWKRIVGDCCVVWIVTEIKRAASQETAWKILSRVSRFIGNGGECQRICFICSKSDVTGISHGRLPGEVHKLIVKRNTQAKEQVKQKIKNKKKPFSDNCFEVFTVSSREFLEKEHLDPEETEIPKLQKLLKELNNLHSETKNYVSGAFTILSLIQDAKHKKAGDKNENVCAELKNTLGCKYEQIKKEIEEVYKTFEKCLSKGVENSKKEDEKKLTKLLDKEDGRGFHRTLKSVVLGGGVHKTRKEINFNVELASCLTNSIDEKFSKIFPCASWSDTIRINPAVTYKPFNGSISAFSLGTDLLTTECKDLKLQLDFLKMEEEKIKEKLNETIRIEKKMIYNSLLETIETKMKECYEEAAKCGGNGQLHNMKTIIKSHVRSNKEMYEEAKNAMLEKVDALKSTILEELEKAMTESIEFSLRTDNNSLPDVSEELEKVTKHHDELLSSQH
ncbi:nuclear GTPase SLIP-GC-like isoform X1 [Maylandia zebra]|uniref:nuclear GTPase SLIP-GC-like isoform X1 n=2 Tax=Maylandia zebra TaxID=106582 RepID=UPI00403CFF02